MLHLWEAGRGGMSVSLRDIAGAEIFYGSFTAPVDMMVNMDVFHNHGNIIVTVYKGMVVDADTNPHRSIVRIKFPDHIPLNDNFVNCAGAVLYNYGSIVCQVLVNFGKIINFGKIYARRVIDLGSIINGRLGSSEPGAVHRIEPGTVVEVRADAVRELPPLPNQWPLPPLSARGRPLPAIPNSAMSKP